MKDKFQTGQNIIVRYILDYEPGEHLECSNFYKLKFIDVENKLDYHILKLYI